MRSSIVFDFDDTLIVSRADRSSVLLDALNSFGVSTNPEALDRLWGRPFEELVAGVAPETRGKFQTFLTHYAEVLASRPPTPCPGVVQTLPRLRENHHLFVHSASHSLLVRTDLQSLGVLDCFEFVCGSDWQPVPKPDPRSLAMMGALLESCGVSLKGGWYVGDSQSDRQIAASAGLKFVAVSYDEEMVAAFPSDGDESLQVIRSLADLVFVVDR